MRTYSSDDIRDIRIRLNLSQMQFAEYLGVGIATVQRWERGHARPIRHLVPALEDADRASRAPRKRRLAIA